MDSFWGSHPSFPISCPYSQQQSQTLLQVAPMCQLQVLKGQASHSYLTGHVLRENFVFLTKPVFESFSLCLSAAFHLQPADTAQLQKTKCCGWRAMTHLAGCAWEWTSTLQRQLLHHGHLQSAYPQQTEKATTSCSFLFFLVIHPSGEEGSRQIQ